MKVMFLSMSKVCCVFSSCLYSFCVGIIWMIGICLFTLNMTKTLSLEGLPCQCTIADTQINGE